MKRIFIFLIISIYASTAFEQSYRIKITTNTFDSSGKKTEFWLQVADNYKTETYYQHGIKNGI